MVLKTNRMHIHVQPEVTVENQELCNTGMFTASRTTSFIFVCLYSLIFNLGMKAIR